MAPEKGEEDFFGQIEPKESRKAGREIAVNVPLFSTDRTQSFKEYSRVITEAEKMAQNADLIQMVNDKKLHFTVLYRLSDEYEINGRPDPKNLKEKVKTAILQLMSRM